MVNFSASGMHLGEKISVEWINTSTLSPLVFTCGHCGESVSSNDGYFASGTKKGWKILLCHHCGCPTFFDHNDNQVPGSLAGNEVSHLPQNIHALYNEARNCCTVNAYTASILACRKLLMNISVEQGAKEGLSFVDYIDFLAENGYIPPNGKGWVDHIRKKGNEATHEIAIKTQDEAEQLITFAEMMLKFIFEFPAKHPTAPEPNETT